MRSDTKRCPPEQLTAGSSGGRSATGPPDTDWSVSEPSMTSLRPDPLGWRSPSGRTELVGSGPSVPADMGVRNRCRLVMSRLRDGLDRVGDLIILSGGAASEDKRQADSPGLIAD